MSTNLSPTTDLAASMSISVVRLSMLLAASIMAMTIAFLISPPVSFNFASSRKSTSSFGAAAGRRALQIASLVGSFGGENPTLKSSRLLMAGSRCVSKFVVKGENSVFAASPPPTREIAFRWRNHCPWRGRSESRVFHA